MRINILSVTFLAAFVFTIGCRNEVNKKANPEISSIKNQEKICLSTSEKELILQAILGTEDFQMFLHPEVEGRLPVKLVLNDMITPDLKIMSNGIQVEFRDSLSLPNGKEHRITFKKIDCEKKEVSYAVFYPIEGAVITGIIHKSDTLWIASKTTWGEKD